MVIDGVFDPATTGGVAFRPATGIDANAITQVQACVRRRLLRVFVRRRPLPDDDARVMRQWAHRGGSPVDGTVRIEAADRAGREHMLRCCARPPFALEQLRQLDRERLVYDHPQPGPGGRGALLLTLLALLDRLAALVPPPRIPRHHYIDVGANGRSRDISAATRPSGVGR